MKLRAVPLVAVGIAGLLLASAVGAVVVSRDDDDEVRSDSSTTSSFPPFEESTSSSALPEQSASVVPEVAPPASVAPVPPPESASTTSSTPPAAAATPTLVTDPAPCQAPASQPAPGSPIGPSGVFSVALGDGTVRLTNPTGRQPAWRPRTAQVVSVTSAAGKQPALCLSAPDGGGAANITTPVGVGRPALSFDGSRVAVRSGRSGGADLVTYAYDGGDRRVLLQAPDIGEPAWLGNGSNVIVCAVLSGQWRLVAVPAGGGQPRIMRDTCPNSPVSSSPDGNRLAYIQGGQVTVMNVGSRATTNLRIGAASTATAPTWAPDSRRVAFAFSDATGPALGVLQLDPNSGSTRFRAPGLTTPSWAPAGELIAYVATDGAAQGVFAVKPDGTGSRLVARCQSRCTLGGQPWATDASSLVLEAAPAA